MILILQLEEWDGKACEKVEEYAEESDDDEFEFLPLDQIANSLPNFMESRTSPGRYTILGGLCPETLSSSCLVCQSRGL